MKSRKIFSMIVVLALIISFFTACNGGTAQSTDSQNGQTEISQSVEGKKQPRNGSKFKIGYSNISLVYNSYVSLEKTIKEKCAEMGYEYVATDAQGDINKQMADLEDLALDCDFIFVNTFDPDILVPTINSIAQVGIPVVSLDNRLSDETQLLTTIQSDNYTNGVLVGNWVAKTLKPGKIKAVILSGEKSSNVGLIRRNAMIEGILEERYRTEGSAEIEIIAQAYTEWLPEKSAAVMEDILALNEDFDVLLSEADVMAMEAMKVLKDAGKTDVLIAAAADAQKEALELIKNGEYGCTGLNSFVELGNIAVDTAIKWFDGQTNFPAFTYTPTACITKENVDKYYDPNAIF